ncbi:MAG: ABC transporter permease [Coriobacteriia bacterium]
MLRRAAPFLPALAALGALGLHELVPDAVALFVRDDYGLLLIALSASLSMVAVIARWSPQVDAWLWYRAPLLAAALVGLVVWEILTAKSQLLPLPFFPSPGKVLGAITGDAPLLAVSALHSLRLLLLGYLLGVAVGVPAGLLMGWSRPVAYWLNPIVRAVGPIPASAWIPIVMVAFPSSFGASVFLIALSAWFPITVMTWSGVSNVDKSYFEVAETLGAGPRYMLLRVALPAALPTVFVGLFMGLGMSFVTLIVAEMLGVRAGLGWYIQWAQGWGEYYKIYAALIIMGALFSALISLLFRARDRYLGWQKGLIKW